MGKIKNKSTAPLGESNTDPQEAENAFLVISGTNLFPLNRSVTTIGRRIDNALVINDPRVSRTHAELRNFDGHFVVFDMDSSGGTYLNGSRVTHSVVYDGDVISLAGVQLVFRQSNMPRPDLIKTAIF